jgi:hypothetical protein
MTNLVHVDLEIGAHCLFAERPTSQIPLRLLLHLRINSRCETFTTQRVSRGLPDTFPPPGLNH